MYVVHVIGCLPAARDVYEVLTAFVAGMTVEDVCSRLHPRLLGINERPVLIHNHMLFTGWQKSC